MRHPFYAAYLLSYIAGTVSSGNLWTISVFVGMAYVYGRAVTGEEVKLAKSEFRPAWLAWKERTGMLVPRLSILVRGVRRDA